MGYPKVKCSYCGVGIDNRLVFCKPSHKVMWHQKDMKGEVPRAPSAPPVPPEGEGERIKRRGLGKKMMVSLCPIHHRNAKDSTYYSCGCRVVYR